MADYSYWKAAVSGQNPKMYVDEPQVGFYRKPVKQRDAKGNNKRVGWEPVAIFMEAGEIVVSIGCNEIFVTDRDRINELWSYVAGNPVSEEAWRDVAERGQSWPDEVPAADRVVTATDNDSPSVETPETHAAAIDNAIAAAVKAVTNEDDAAKALGSKNRIAELRLAADKAGKAIYDPPYREYVKLRDSWTAPVKRASDAEAELNKMYLTWQESERKRLVKEAEEAAAKLDIAATPEPVAAPVAVAPTYGKKAPKLKPKKFAIVNDYAAALAYFKDDAELRERVEKLATDAVRAGKTVPGVTTREGLI